MSATVVIPSLGRAPALPHLLRSLAGQDYSGHLQILVVTDEAEQNAVEQVVASSKVRIVEVLVASTKGSASARNLGIASARERSIVFVDDDMTIDSGFVSAHCTQLESAPEVVSIGKIHTAEQGSFMAKAKARWLNDHYQRLEIRPVAPRDLYSGNFAVSSSLLETHGGFDPAWPSLHDTELGIRLSNAGALFVYARDALACQDVVKSNLEILSDYASVGAFRARLVKRYGTSDVPELSSVNAPISQIVAGAMARLPDRGWRAAVTLLARDRLLNTRLPLILRTAAVARGRATLGKIPEID